ncbi:MAG: sugar phosphate isomerase/epimerase [Opitutaceae bacterium]|nr:sugar phosphate isomerase/epimerase [Opitutaceae bacterium]
MNSSPHPERINRRTFIGGAVASTVALAGIPRTLAENPNVQHQRWRIGHHFWNWDHAWNNAAFLDRRLQLTKETGYAGFEAKPAEIGHPPGAVREKCAALGLTCAAIGASPKEGIAYAAAAGAGILRTSVAREETQRWVDAAGEHRIILVVHPHVGTRDAPGAVETREDLLRYLDERPGVFACPDTGHLALCGSDPVQTIRDLGRRCRYIHLKDLPAHRINNKHAPGEKFCELGTGALDLAGVIKALEDIRYEGWIMVERDSREPDYVRSARNMRAVLKKFGC